MRNVLEEVEKMMTCVIKYKIFDDTVVCSNSEDIKYVPNKLVAFG